ncbi:MAG: hypothetical protein ACE5HI_07445 [bacterium]
MNALLLSLLLAAHTTDGPRVVMPYCLNFALYSYKFAEFNKHGISPAEKYKQFKEVPFQGSTKNYVREAFEFVSRNNLVNPHLAYNLALDTCLDR